MVGFSPVRAPSAARLTAPPPSWTELQLHDDDRLVRAIPLERAGRFGEGRPVPRIASDGSVRFGDVHTVPLPAGADPERLWFEFVLRISKVGSSRRHVIGARASPRRGRGAVSDAGGRAHDENGVDGCGDGEQRLRVPAAHAGWL